MKRVDLLEETRGVIERKDFYLYQASEELKIIR